jgi:hypothetical protein
MIRRFDLKTVNIIGESDLRAITQTVSVRRPAAVDQGAFSTTLQPGYEALADQIRRFQFNNVLILRLIGCGSPRGSIVAIRAYP